MWKILVKDAFGLIILVDNSSPDPLQDIDAYLDGFADELRNIPCVVGVGRTESHPSPSIEQFSEKLANSGLILPVIPVDVRNKEDVVLLVNIIIAQAEADFSEVV